MGVRLRRFSIITVIIIGLMVGAMSSAFAASERQTQRTLRAARSAIGTPYRYGGSSLNGFDCSGLTMWAWNRGHVNLPHSAYQQRQKVRNRVNRAHLQRGDLLFFYSPVSHVGLYVGHGKMIAASHSGSRVHRQDVYWGSFVGGARPGH